MTRLSLVDSDTLSEILKGRNSKVNEPTKSYFEVFPKLSFTSISVYEILFGLNRISANAQIRRTNALFSANDEITPDSGDYRLAAEIASRLALNGTPIGFADPIIASCAIRRNLVLATGNTSHFRFIQDIGYSIELDDWRS